MDAAEDVWPRNLYPVADGGRDANGASHHAFVKGEESLRLRGFSAGADDFVIKSFSMRELIARVHALLRAAGLLWRTACLFEAIFNLITRPEGSVGVYAMSVSTEPDSGYSNVCLSDLAACFLANTCWTAFGDHQSTFLIEQSMST
jgi:hypothetical protein